MPLLGDRPVSAVGDSFKVLAVGIGNARSDLTPLTPLTPLIPLLIAKRSRGLRDLHQQ